MSWWQELLDAVVLIGGYMLVAHIADAIEMERSTTLLLGWCAGVLAMFYLRAMATNRKQRR